MKVITTNFEYLLAATFYVLLLLGLYIKQPVILIGVILFAIAYGLATAVPCKIKDKQLIINLHDVLFVFLAGIGIIGLFFASFSVMAQ